MPEFSPSKHRSVATFHGFKAAASLSGPAAAGRGAGIHPSCDKSGRWLVTAGCTVSYCCVHYRVESIHDGVLFGYPLRANGVPRRDSSLSVRCSDVHRVMQ